MSSADTIILGTKTYSIVKRGEHGMDLRGPRGAVYTFVRNIHNPSDWTLISNHLRPRTEHYIKTDDGFMAAESLAR